jgi:hypothetical protein
MPEPGPASIPRRKKGGGSSCGCCSGKQHKDAHGERGHRPGLQAPIRETASPPAAGPPTSRQRPASLTAEPIALGGYEADKAALAMDGGVDHSDATPSVYMMYGKSRLKYTKRRLNGSAVHGQAALLGKGSFGVVYRGVNLTTGCRVAIKLISMPSSSDGGFGECTTPCAVKYLQE